MKHTTTTFRSTLIAAIIAALSFTQAAASLSDHARAHLPALYADQVIALDVDQLGSDEIIRIKGAGVRLDLYHRTFFIEVEIKDLHYNKEIFVVTESNRDQVNNRNTRVQFVQRSSADHDWATDYSNPNRGPKALYIGKTEDNYSRFIIYTTGLVANTYVNFYVNMSYDNMRLNQFSNRAYLRN